MSSLSSGRLTAVSLLATAVIAGIDGWLGPDISMSLFYLIPVALTAWYGSLNLSIALSLMCSAVMVGLDLLHTGTTYAIATKS